LSHEPTLEAGGVKFILRRLTLALAARYGHGDAQVRPTGHREAHGFIMISV
jgi:hypothetical protein